MAAAPQRQQPRKKSDRRRVLRAAAGRKAARSAAPLASGNRLSPEQALLVDCWTGVVALAMVVHALGALVYGRLSVFVLDGFADLHGRAALCGAAAEIALVCGVLAHRMADGTHTGRRWPEALYRVRLWAYWSALALACVAAVLAWVDRPRIAVQFPVQWAGLAPQSDWLLSPLPWVWPWLLPMAQDRVQFWLLFGAFGALAVGALCVSGTQKKPRAGLGFFGMAFVGAGFWSLGGALYHYVAARGLAQQVQDAALAAMLQARPGQHNADTLLWYLSAGSLTLAGVLFLATAVSLPQDRLDRAFAGVS